MDVESLREREKELRCLYQVQQFTLNPSSPLEDVFYQIVESLGPGWQRPETTGACIEYFGRSYRSSNYEPSAPRISASLKLGDQEIGQISISDSCPDFDGDSDDVYLEEEEQLLKSVSALLSNFLEWRHLEVLGKRLASSSHSHWQWREKVVAGMIDRFDGNRFGDTEFYLGGSTELGQASHGSDIDIYLFHVGTDEQRELLKLWLEGWSMSIAEMAKIQTGELFPDGIFNVRWLDKTPDTKRHPELRKVGRVTGMPGDSKKAPSSKERTSEVEAMVQRTLLGLSHELRNPLTAVSTNLDLLSQTLPSKLKAQTISDAQQALSAISVLIKDLMLFLRAETGLEKPPLEETELESFLTSVVSRLRLKNDKAQIVFQGKKPPEVDLRARLNRRITERILDALVLNSVRYSQSDQVLISVFPLEDNEVVISVKDEGCGIDVIHHDKLFEQFYRLESSRNKLSGGVGLGLPLAQALAKSQNSKLQLISRPGEGTDVRVIFARL
jgi:signal transduction histidine kinase